MSPNELSDQVVKYLTDAHSIEEQALVQMKAAPKLAGDPELAEMFERHRVETEAHESLIKEQLSAHDADPSKLKDLAGRVTGRGFGMFAASNPDTPGKLLVHGYSYEHMEAAAYDMLARIAERAGDPSLVEVARRIEAQEREMAERVAGCFDRGVELSLRDVPSDDIQKQLGKYLADAHAIEGQSLKLLDKGAEMIGGEQLAAAMEHHHAETVEHLRLIERRLQDRAQSTNAIKDAALKLGALNWGGFFGAQPDTPIKLAAFAYAVEHLEIAAYEMLRRVAERAGDTETVTMADRILVQERAAAETVRSLFGEAIDVTWSERVTA